MTKIPSPEEQCDIIKKIEKESLAIGDQVCPISSQWYQSWKSSVNYDNLGVIAAEIDPIDNSKIIENGKLVQNALEYFNYYLIHKQSYDLLQQWFSGGPTIVLDVISDSRGKPVVPTRTLILKINYNNEEKPIEAHKYMKISEIHHKAKLLFNVPEDQNTRLVDFFNGSVGEVFDDQKFIENYSIYSNGQIILDTQDKDTQKWFSDSLKISNKRSNSSSSSSSSSSSDDLYSRSSVKKVSSKSSTSSSAGIVGFNNLGNTCFFNSGTQCLMHTVPLVAKFVTSDEWEKDLNYTNKIGMKGQLAKAFADLAKKVWSGGYSSLSPSNLKHVIGRFRDTFSGYDQQDSHELIYAMLDGIHEDLNRCRDRSAVDMNTSVEGDGTNDEETSQKAWERYKKLNDSIVVDIFDGLVRSRLICPNCHCTTIVFDPYRSIAMPIAKPHTQKVKITYVPFDFLEKRKQLKIEVPQSGKKDFSEAASVEISKLIGKTVKVKVGARLYSNYPITWGIKNLNTSATVYAYEIPDNEDATYIACSIDISTKRGVYSASSTKICEKIATPFLVDVSDLPDDFDDDEKVPLFVKKVEEKLSCLWPEEKDKAGEKEEEDWSDFIQKFNKKMDLSPPYGVTFSDPSQKLCVSFKSGQTSYYYGTVQTKQPIKTPNKTWKNILKSRAIISLNEDSNFSIPNLVRNISVPSEKDKEESSKKDQISLDHCFEFFTSPEVLDENNKWYCPKCKQFVCAEKKMDIWQVPNILIIQLKRFFGSGYSMKKLDHYVDFPEILDMKKYVFGPQKNEDEIKFRLYAVSNQYGSLGFGHYTAEARVRNPINNIDKGWYDFDDSYASSSSEDKAHSSAAYVLFYERIK